MPYSFLDSFVVYIPHADEPKQEVTRYKFILCSTRFSGGDFVNSVLPRNLVAPVLSDEDAVDAAKPFFAWWRGRLHERFLSDRRWGLRTADFGPAIGRAQPHWKLPTRWIFEISFVELSIGAAKNLADNTLHIACSFPRIAVDSQGYFWAGLFRLRGRAKVKTF